MILSWGAAGDKCRFCKTKRRLWELPFPNQDELPRLPIPKLEETANKLLHFLEALQSTPQKLHAQQQVLEFIKGDGPKLQSLLREYEQSGIEEGILGSYIEEFWNESNLVPLADDDDTLPLSAFLNLNNPFFLLEDSPDPEFAKHPIRRAASLTLAAMKVASTIRDETFPPDTFKEHPLCMDQYKAVFGAARVPQVYGGDDIDVYPNATHVVVMCRNQMYYFQAMWPDTGVLAVDEEDVYDILMAIDRNSLQTDKAAAAQTCPGVLTTLPRREWAKIRDQLGQGGDERNAQYLTIVDSALFVLVLDDGILTSSIDEKAANILHGTVNVDHHEYNQYDEGESSDADDPEPTPPSPPSSTSSTPPQPFGSGCNRWYDKIQIIVSGDGTAGVNFEHSAIDSHTALRIVSDIYAETVVQFLQSITKTLPSHGKIPNIVDAPIERAGKKSNCSESNDRPDLDVLPKKITFELPDDVRRKIFHAGTALGDEIVASETKVLIFREFGKKFIVANNLSPDSLVQMSIMLAYYKLYGKMVGVYEPVLTKTFYHGRSEAMRSATIPAKNLCEIFFDAKAQPLSKLSILKRAILVHQRLVKECSAGRGVDRHLYALKCMAQRNGLQVPNLFESEPWHMLNHSILLAANCGNPSLRLFGISPVVPDGYGIGYIIKDHSIHYCLTSKRRQTSRFVMALEYVLRDLGNLLHTHSLDTRNNPPGARLNDIIEEVPEGKASSNTNGASPVTHSYDMWGLRRPGEDEPPAHAASPSDTAIASPPGRWEHEAAAAASVEPTPIASNRKPQPNRQQQQYQLTVPLHPMSDDDTSSGEQDFHPLPAPRQPRRAPRRGRKSAPGAMDSSGHAGPSDALPALPQRRGSMFTGMSRRQSLTMHQLNQSGTSLDFQSFDLSERSDPYAMGMDTSERSDPYMMGGRR
jgi:carnitine O-acetyltransferase